MSKLDIEGEYVPCGGTFYKYPIPINRETSMVLVRKASHCVLVYLAFVSRLVPQELQARHPCSTGCRRPGGLLKTREKRKRWPALAGPGLAGVCWFVDSGALLRLGARA